MAKLSSAVPERAILWDRAWLGDAPEDPCEGICFVAFLKPGCGESEAWVPFLNVMHGAANLPRVIGVMGAAADAMAAFVKGERVRFPVVAMDEALIGRLVKGFPAGMVLEEGVISRSCAGSIPGDLMEGVKEIYAGALWEQKPGPAQAGGVNGGGNGAYGGNGAEAQPAAGAAPRLRTSRELLAEARERIERADPPFADSAIERRSGLSMEAFFTNYFFKGRPVILTGMMDHWAAMSRWNPDDLGKRFAEVEVEVQTQRESDANYEINSVNHKEKMSMKQYAAWVSGSDKSNDIYMVANNLNLSGALTELGGDYDFSFFGPPVKNRDHFWFGPGGTITPLHHDMVQIIFAQVYGRKRWRMISPRYSEYLYHHTGVFSEVDCEIPDYNKHPRFARAVMTEVVLEPGEMLFVPEGWWHQVKALDVSVSVSHTLHASISSV